MHTTTYKQPSAVARRQQQTVVGKGQSAQRQHPAPIFRRKRLLQLHTNAQSAKDERLEGMTVSLWVKRTDDIPWDAIWSFYNPAVNTRLYLTGNSYVGFNNGKDWFDINHPGSIISEHIPVGKWCLVTITISRSQGCTIYVNGSKIRDVEYIGNCNGINITDTKDFDYNRVIDFIQSCPNFYLGYGSFWGSVDVRMDDLILYNRALEATDVRALNTMSNRVTDFSIGEGGCLSNLSIFTGTEP